jgi:hypothetical protein
MGPRLGRRERGHLEGLAQMARRLATGQRSRHNGAQLFLLDPVAFVGSFGELRHDLAREKFH